MRSDLYWIPGMEPGKLAVMPRPRGGAWLKDEIEWWHEAGIRCVVSLLEAVEVQELELEEEPALCASAGIEYLSLPIPDRSVPPSTPVFRQVVHKVCDYLAGGTTVALHCRAGIGRVTLLAGALLIQTGASSEDALQRISDARGLSVPDTEEQRRWLQNFAAYSRRF